jgi:protoheme IX farnesyltransferase
MSADRLPTPLHPEALPAAAASLRPPDLVTLTKPRLNFLVLLTTLVGYYLGTKPGAGVAVLVHTLVGTALVAGGASALNQVWERTTDAMMRRTRMRPLPDGRMQPREASAFGLLLSAAGLIELAVFVNVLTSAMALASLVSYMLFYTPLKTRTSLSTIVGAVPGALPAVIGWTAATNTLSIESWVLFAIVFMWQMPHFLAIAWLYRHEYAAAGIRLLPVIEPDGRSTGRQAVLYTAGLVPISLAPALVDLASPYYMMIALVLGAVLMVLSLEFAFTRTRDAARRLFYGSIMYLPLLWAFLVGDHLMR